MNGLDSLLPGLAGAQNMHPIFVHFPAALLPTALALQLLALARGRDAWGGHARVCLYLGTLGALAAVGTGFLAAEYLGHDSPGHTLVHTHRNIVVAAALLAVLTSGAALAVRKQPHVRDRVVTLGLLLTSGVLVAGADRGANMVFRYGIGVANEPVPAGAHGMDEHGQVDAETSSVGPDSQEPRDPHGDGAPPTPTQNLGLGTRRHPRGHRRGMNMNTMGMRMVTEAMCGYALVGGGAKPPRV